MLYILHGRGSNPSRAWIPWLKSELELRDYQVIAPKLPSTRFPSPNKWELTLDNLVNSNSRNNYVAYSLSAQTVLRYVAKGKGNPENIFLVAPFQEVNYDRVYQETMSMAESIHLPNFISKELAKLAVRNSHKWCDNDLPWGGLKRYQDKLHLFFSDSDYYVSSNQIDLFQSKLPNASYHIEKNAGHFATADGYRQFPLLLNMILENASFDNKIQE